MNILINVLSAYTLSIFVEYMLRHGIAYVQLAKVLLKSFQMFAPTYTLLLLAEVECYSCSLQCFKWSVFLFVILILAILVAMW